jgi:hypothetical protein
MLQSELNRRNANAATRTMNQNVFARLSISFSQ